MLEIIAVNTAKDFDIFIALPRLLYKDMPGFSAPLDMERRMLLDRKKSAFFNHGNAQYWLARQDGKNVGRISAQISSIDQPELVETGYFGCFDCIDNPEAAQGLLAAAELWLRDHGKTTIRGPFTLTINNESGLLIEGHLEPPMLLTPWTPLYLEAHVLAGGYVSTKDLLTYTINGAQVRERKNIDRISGRLKDAGVEVRSIDLRQWRREAEIVCELFNDAWSENWNFIPFQVDEILAMFKEMKPFLTNENGVIVEVHGKPSAFGIGIQNLAELSRDFDGQLLPFNWLKFLWRMKFHKQEGARILLMGSRKELHHSVIGSLVPMLLLDKFATSAINQQLKHIELGWVLENNGPTRAMAERQGARISRRHRVYEKTLAS